MRQGNSKQRMRGRSGNGGPSGGGTGRKGPNPLSRSYESTGPDVKIRGTALHIAEKYVSLARDAHSSGDPVLAESYLQHAEHYYRIIAAAQAQSPQSMSIIRSDLQNDDDDDDAEGYQETRFDTRTFEPRVPEVRAPEPRSPDARVSETRIAEPREPREHREPREAREPREIREVREPREPREAREPRIEARSELRIGDEGYMPIDAPQPFVDELPGERPRNDQRPAGDRVRGRGFRNGPRSDGRPGDAPRPEGGRFEGRPPRERYNRAEPRSDDAAPRESDLEQLPAFLMTPTPRPAAAAAAAAPTPAPVPVAAPVVAAAPIAAPVEATEVGEDGETPRRRTRGGRGRGRRPEFEGGEPTETKVVVEE
ncbi:DUF4167 domain-containing protein [Siculibacillus lacustris]|uniref:DUF4167 domain-containing protein n=1 Tax=Siculibacillus lacustris TaxID=1549641 RepID=A0A4V2KU81_9HYPH|nr:DUF4167 domain-containing protein [Siculibacillus lacustris]TBW40455.1 DUF4167 domain-containing protein [Siculibacillus lacustris]